MQKFIAAIVFSLAAGPLAVWAADFEVKLVIENHRFTPEIVKVPAGQKVKLVIENRDATPEEFDSHALNREKVISGKSTASIFIGPLKAGSYPFVGEFNEKTAKGVVLAE
ncbi:MAG: cupredoxin domain-containing protein [Betaproteobacteria bacterium]|nr:cupredoxin domain-containing protein [Betaproteobacteria bacterium]